MDRDRFITWDTFVKDFGKEMVSANDVFQSMRKRGLKDFSLTKFDYHFLSDNKKKLISLNEFLINTLKYKFNSIIKYSGGFDLSGMTYPIPITEENLLYWDLHMYKLGYEFDCRFDAYGSPWDPKNQTMLDLSKEKEDEYFNEAIRCYETKDLSGAIFYWTSVLQINPKEVNSYYSRAIVKNELYTWKAALEDYNIAIELAPDFTDAIINRAAIKDENGDYMGAMNDYDTAIKLSPQNAMAYFNRGNTRFNMGDKKGALRDWETSKQLGADYAEERITEYSENN